MVAYSGLSDGPGVPGVRGDAGEFDADGVVGFANSGPHVGVLGIHRAGGAGVKGFSDRWDGVQGFSQHIGAAGVRGDNTVGVGVRGRSGGVGVQGFSQHEDGVQGTAQDGSYSGVLGTNTYSDAGLARGTGVTGQCEEGVGVRALSMNGVGLVAVGAEGIVGDGTRGHGVRGLSRSKEHAGVVGGNDAGGLAASFLGTVRVTGSIFCPDVICANGDIAEEFPIADAENVAPGTVMVLRDDGTLEPSDRPYDGRVAGVIAGAGDYRPGILLDRQSQAGRLPVAMIGKTYCMVDATYAPVGVGDLLTSSGTLGHAMKVIDGSKAFGATIGKAMRPLRRGRGLIPILATLQ